MRASGERPAHGAAVLDREAAAKELEPQELVGRGHHADVGVIEIAVDDHGIGRVLGEGDGHQGGRCARGSTAGSVPSAQCSQQRRYPLQSSFSSTIAMRPSSTGQIELAKAMPYSYGVGGDGNTGLEGGHLYPRML